MKTPLAPPVGLGQRLLFLIRLFSADKWATPAPGSEPKFWRGVYFSILAGRLFTRNRGPARAAALAYTTILAFIPVLAMVLSITTGILKNDEKRINEWTEQAIERVAGLFNLQKTGTAEEAAASRESIVKSITGYIANVRSGTVGATAAVALIFVAISLLATIETAFNDIWGVSQGRTWFARVVQYWAAITLGPFLVLIPLGLTTSKQFTVVKTFVEQFPFVGGLLFQLLPAVVIVGVFIVFYKVMPATKVKWSSALVGGGVGGGLLLLNYVTNVVYASKAVSYSKIYGSLGAIPLFLVGLYFSWMILLLGAQVAYVWQNWACYQEERSLDEINTTGRELAALRVMTHLAQRFDSGIHETAAQMALPLGIPLKLVEPVLDLLVEGALVIRVEGDPVRFSAARPLEKICFADVLDAARNLAGRPLSEHSADPVRGELAAVQQRIHGAAQKEASETTLAKFLADEQKRGK